MKQILVILAILLLCGFAYADEVSITRDTAYEWACADAAGLVISAHTRQNKAIESCVNRSLSDGLEYRILAGEYRLQATIDAPPVDPPIGPIPDPIPDPDPGPIPVGDYRAVPDPTSVIGFDPYGQYATDETLSETYDTLVLTTGGSPGVPYVYDLQGAVMNALGVQASNVLVRNFVIANDSESALGMQGNNIVFINGDIGGPQTDWGHGAAIFPDDRSVFINIKVHNFGVLNTSQEQDQHGWKIQASDVWILDSEAYEMSGDGIQVGDASRGRGDRVYIGGGHYYNNRENGIDIKDSSNVVVSGVRMDGFRPTSSSPGEAVIIHDDAVGAKIYDNVITDSTIGIVSSGQRDHDIDGNIIVALSQGLQLRNTQNIRVQNNDITAPVRINVQGGITGSIQP